MKKIIIVFLLVFLLMMICGCSNDQKKDDEHLKIVTTTFPLYDWVISLLKDNPAGIEITMLLDKGVDLHSYQPTAKDVMDIKNCNIFVYVGGESDEWVDDVFANNDNSSPIVIDMMDCLKSNLKVEELKEGMETEGEGEEDEYDEHIWLSLKNAMVCIEQICEKLIQLDADNKDYYLSNRDKYLSQLSDLDKEYVKTVSQAKNKTLIFGDRFPFRYLFDDYGIDYYAAFKGCSAESEASFETIVFLAGKADELNQKYIMIIDGSNGKIAATINENTQAKNLRIVSLDSLQSCTMEDHLKGKSYLSVMNDDLIVLKEVLN
ncbi:MAG: zinc ABC transporter substrate-binding protein [Erysipelotrichaceae bacterium]|nr:zinc ABC transporter substrate-binding protein [Erysipelotrichaceae bacterium]